MDANASPVPASVPTPPAAETIRNEYYYDESAGIRVCLQKAIGTANKRLAHQADRLGLKTTDEIHELGIEKFNEACRQSVMKYTGEWRDYVTRQARWVDFDNDYKTLDTVAVAAGDVLYLRSRIPSTCFLGVPTYGKMEILRGVSLRVEPGQIVSIIGPNGAGKSTVFRTLFGLLPARQGSVRFADEDVTNHSPAALLRRGMTYVPQGRNVFPLMTVEENLELGCYAPVARTARDARLERVYAIFPVLRARRRQAAGTLSGGEQQMVAMARALMSRPKLMLMDEPSMGLAPILVERSFEIIQQVNEAGVAMLVVEQNANVSLSIAHRGYVLSTGRIVLEGPAAELLENDDLRKAYLGR